jgi:hypothetical protein
MLPLVRTFSYCLLAIVLLIALHTTHVYACSQLASAPHSQWKVETHQGVSWLITPCGERFFSIGVNVLNGGYPSRIYKGRLAYHWGTFYSTLETWVTATLQRLAAWGFNTAGGWSLKPSQLPLPFIANLELGRQSLFVWSDPFRPTMEEEMRTWAHRLVAPYKGSPYRIGYFSDNEIGWWYSAMFTYYLQLTATNYTKQKLVALLREHYAETWEQFMGDFVPPTGVTSFEALLQSSDVRTYLRPGGEGIRVLRRWMSMVAEQYYRLAHRAIREADPDALIFGDRQQIYYDPDAIRHMASYVDVVATNYDVDVPDGSIARYFFDGLRQLTHKPLLISEWFFAAQENRSGNHNQGHLMTVQTQAERARGAAAAAQEFAKLPQLLGLHWFQYYDHPLGGRPDDHEDYNFGLVDLYDRPYEELTEAFARINPRLAGLHQEAKPISLALPPGTPFEIPEADINPHDRSLIEWPKARALVSGLTAPSADVVFGDIYLTWNQAGVYLAAIMMDYYDPELLAFGNETFPLGEAFHVDWGIDAGAGPQRLVLYMVPPKEYRKDGTSHTRAHLCRLTNGTCEPVPGTVAHYLGTETPRIVAEVALPWHTLGVDGPPAAGQLRMELAATSYHRARWMSWSGLPPAVGLQDTTAWHTVRLGGR